MDEAARQTGIDRIELRRRNFIRPEQFPFTTVTGTTYTDTFNVTSADGTTTSVVVNAFGGRFYEPGPPRSFYGGMVVKF